MNFEPKFNIDDEVFRLKNYPERDRDMSTMSEPWVEEVVIDEIHSFKYIGFTYNVLSYHENTLFSSMEAAEKFFYNRKLFLLREELRNIEIKLAFCDHGVKL